jgi:hypothetical protein
LNDNDSHSTDRSSNRKDQQKWFDDSTRRNDSRAFIPKWLNDIQDLIEKVENSRNESAANKTSESAQQLTDQLQQMLLHKSLESVAAVHKTLDLAERLQRHFEHQMQQQSSSNQNGDPEQAHRESHRKRVEFAQSMLQGYSAMLDDRQRSAWTQSEPEVRTRGAERMIAHVLKLSVKLSCNLDHKINETDADSENVNAPHVMVGAIRLPSQLPLSFRFPPLSANRSNRLEHLWLRFPLGLSLSNMTQSDAAAATWHGCNNQSSASEHKAVGALIDHLSQHLLSRDALLSQSPTSHIRSLDELVRLNHVQVGSPLIVFSLDADPNHSRQLPQPVQVRLQHHHRLVIGEQAICAFWNVTTGNWDSSGCRLIQSARAFTTCECDHLTSFAVLIDIRQKHVQPFSAFWDDLANFSAVISFLGLIATSSMFLTIRRLRTRRNLLTANLCLCLALVDLLVCFAMESHIQVQSHQNIFF